MRFDSVINKFVFESNFNNRITIHGDGKQARAFIHIDHITKIFDQLLTSDAPSGTYNLVGHNMNILDIVDVMKAVNPDLEFIFINQHLKLRNILVNADLKLSNYLNTNFEISFSNQIKDFHDKFSF